VHIAVKLRAAMALALLGTVALAVVPAPASAAPEVVTASVTGSGVVDWTGATARRDGKPLGQPLVLPGRTRAGVDTVITCYVYHAGPSLLGGYVNFSITIQCYGGVPQYLEVRQDMARHIAPGNWVLEPGSSAICPAYSSPILLCSSVTRCFQAGAYYDGYAVLYGIDELGLPHWSSYYVPPQWVGCII